MRTIAPLLGLGLTACILQNPKFQDTESGGGSGSTSTGASATDGATTTGASASAGTTASGSASASGTTTTTGDPSASATGDGSTSSSTGGATCEEPCPTCTACVDGECVPEDMGVACGDSLDCADFVAGVFMTDQGTVQCLAFAPEQLSGRCDGAGACVPAEPSSCAGEGEVLVACDARCVQPVDVGCVKGAAAAEIDLASLCVTEASTDTCPALCEIEEEGTSQFGETCDALGHCVALAPKGCGDYSCHDGGGCLTSCDGPEDCVDKAECVDNKCTQN